eukprot:2813487-Amphidinium_carterae.2
MVVLSFDGDIVTGICTFCYVVAVCTNSTLARQSTTKIQRALHTKEQAPLLNPMAQLLILGRCNSQMNAIKEDLF